MADLGVHDEPIPAFTMVRSPRSRCADPGVHDGPKSALEAMLREEGLYSSALSSWRGQVGRQGAAGLEPRKMGRKPKLDAKDRLNAALLKRTAVLERKLHIAEAVIALQKNGRARPGHTPARRETPCMPTIVSRKEWPPAFWCSANP
jgi:hypothetical protein